MKDIKSKLILKDISENLIHILPDTIAEQVAYNDTNVKEFLDILGNQSINASQIEYSETTLSDYLDNYNSSEQTFSVIPKISATIPENDDSTNVATTAFVQSTLSSKLADADALIFKGTIGTGGTVTSLPATHSVGWTYKVITAGTYAGQTCEVGDLIICITKGTTSNNAHWVVAQNNVDVFTGSTTLADGTSGLVRKPLIADKNKFLKGDGTWSDIEVYSGATTLVNGISGLVPAANIAQKDNYLKGDGTWTEIPIIKDVAVMNEVPTSSNTSNLDNQSIIFYEDNSIGTNLDPVYTTGNQTINGIKRFANGIFGNVKTLGTNETVFDVSVATCFVKTVTTAVTFSFSNVPDDVICCITVVLKNGGNYTVTWPTGVKWSEDTIPDLTRNGTDVLTFITYTAGNVWYGTTSCIGVTT